eukprot:1283260-Pyramimonas_sp.AAC.1
MSFRADNLARIIGQCVVYIARHCSDYARSSGGWVYFGDVVQKLYDDGFAFQSCALAAHGLAALPAGTIEVPGIFPKDSPKIAGALIHALWDKHNTRSLQEINGREMPIPIFYRA